MVEPVLAVVGVVLLLAGCALATVGLIGLLLKPDLFDQLHVAGLVTGPGVILVLLASVGTGSAGTVTSAILVIAFVLITSSISTHVIAHAGARRYTRAETSSSPASTGAPSVTLDPNVDAAAARTRLSSGMRVIVAYDGSPAAHVAADLAAAIDWPGGTVIRLIGVADRDLQPFDPTPGFHTGETLPADVSEVADLARPAQVVQRPGISVETAVLGGDAADVIVDEAVSFGADVLVTGSRRRGLVSSLLGLSAAGDIVDRAPCPVLVARSRALGTVMLTTDGSPQSVLATELVARWPIFDLARIHVVAVSTDPGPAVHATTRAPSRPAGDQRIVDAAAATLMDAGRDVVTEVLHGRPAREIVEAAGRRSIDLIVIGSRGRTGLGRTLLGSVAGEVLASASCSVLIVGPPVRRPPPRVS
ncbi:MAG TPA: universal stress protein [Candidatus Limnocylindrales bacterium]|nr:universal stress protein [Candidatus Limnocylindrales bacterium]